MSPIDGSHARNIRRNVWLAGLLSLLALVGCYVAVIVWLEGRAAATFDRFLARLPDDFHAERGKLRFNPWSQRLEISSLAIEGPAGQRYAASRIVADISYRPDLDAAIAILSGKRPPPPSGTVEKILRYLSAHQVSIRQKDISVQWSYGELTELALDLALLAPFTTGSLSSTEQIVRQIDAVNVARLTLIGLHATQAEMRWTLNRLTLNELRAGTAQDLAAVSLDNSQQGGVGKLTASKIWLTPLVRAAITDVAFGLVAETVRLDDLVLPTAEGRFVKLGCLRLSSFQPLGEVALASSAIVEGLSLTTLDLPWPELTSLLERIGYRRLSVKGVWHQQWQPETRELALQTAQVEVGAMGRANLSLRLSQVDAEILKMGPLLPVDKLLGLLASAQLTSVQLDVSDMGLTSRLIEDQAAKRGLTLMATRARLMEGLTAWLQVNRYHDPFEPVLDGIDAFLRQPGQLTVTATARQPITLPLLMEALMSSPLELARLFEMSAKYRP